MPIDVIDATRKGRRYIRMSQLTIGCHGDSRDSPKQAEGQQLLGVTNPHLFLTWWTGSLLLRSDLPLFYCCFLFLKHIPSLIPFFLLHPCSFFDFCLGTFPIRGKLKESGGGCLLAGWRQQHIPLTIDTTYWFSCTWTRCFSTRFLVFCRKKVCWPCIARALCT